MQHVNCGHRLPPHAGPRDITPYHVTTCTAASHQIIAVSCHAWQLPLQLQSMTTSSDFCTGLAIGLSLSGWALHFVRLGATGWRVAHSMFKSTAHITVQRSYHDATFTQRRATNPSLHHIRWAHFAMQPLTGGVGPFFPSETTRCLGKCVLPVHSRTSEVNQLRPRELPIRNGQAPVPKQALSCSSGDIVHSFSSFEHVKNTHALTLLTGLMSSTS